MTSSQHWELSYIGPDSPAGQPLSEGLGLVFRAPIRYNSLRGARSGRRRLIEEGLAPRTGRIAIVKVTIEEIPEPDPIQAQVNAENETEEIP